MKKKIVTLIVSTMLIVSIVTGCENGYGSQKVNSSTVQEEVQATEIALGTSEVSTEISTEDVSESTTESTDFNEEEAKELLHQLTGTYQELWPVLLSEEFQSSWLDDSKVIVGEENAETAVEKLQSMVTGTVYGEEAAEAYQDGTSMAYYCGFTQDINQFQIDGTTIKGIDKNGNEVFSHEYQYIGMEESRGLYEYKTDDENAGEFTYMYFAPDTSETTYHIEFRYGSDKEALLKYDSGEYAYWMASGLSVDYDETMANNAINLFCTENLSESK